MESFQQSALHGNIFRIQHGEDVLIAADATLNIIPIDTETLVLGYSNFDYSVPDEPSPTRVSPIFASILTWSVTMRTTYTGTAAGRSQFRLQIQIANLDRDTVDTSFTTLDEYILPLYSGIGDRPMVTGERRIHDKYARVAFRNATTQDQRIDYFIFGKVL